MIDREQRVREAAYYLWDEEGRPDGRDQAHWEMAEITIALIDCLRDFQRKGSTNSAGAAVPDDDSARDGSSGMAA